MASFSTGRVEPWGKVCDRVCGLNPFGITAWPLKVKGKVDPVLN